MKKMTAIAALSLAAILPLASMPAFAAPVDAQANLCTEAPQKAAKAGVDCTTTSAIQHHKGNASVEYPSGPVNYGSGIVF